MEDQNELMLDGTGLGVARECLRKWLFQVSYGWQSERPNVHLLFGAAWSKAMDTVWAQLPDIEGEWVEKGAFDAFMDEWNGGNITEEMWPEIEPKTPTRAKEMLPAYIKHLCDSPYRNTARLVALEKPFTIDVGIEGVRYYGMMDKVFEELGTEGTIWGVDHKTTKYTLPVFQKSLRPHGQLEGYQYAGRMMYADRWAGLLVDIASVRKREFEFLFTPLDAAWETLDVWHRELRWWAGLLKQEKWHRNVSSCHIYGGCPFLQVCQMWPDERDLPPKDEPPQGFVSRPWHPLERLKANGGEKVIK